MHFDFPGWILAALPLGLLGWRWPHLRLHSPLRYTALGLLLLVLMRPSFQSTSRELELWTLMDRSLSAAPLEERQGEEILTLLRQSKPPQARLRIADFAEEIREREGTRLELNPTQSRLAEAVRWVLQRRSPNHPCRLLIVSDGFSTQPLQGLAEEALAAGVPIDIRWLLDPGASDVQVDTLDTPTRAAPGEGFLLQARISANFDGPVPYQLLRDGVPIDSGSLTLSRGRAAARFADVLRAEGAHRYELILQPASDAHPENNRAETWILCEGKDSVLLLSPFASDPLVPALESAGFAVRHLRESSELHPAVLASARLVVLHNLPSEKLPQNFKAALPFFVEEQGGGLLMLGGKNSFGSGGYFRSEIDPLLPVSLDLQQKEKKLLTALVILMDRSGSMGASPGGGGAAGALTKMDLANEGAATSLALLGDQDLAAVYAVDTKAHEIVPLSPVGQHRISLDNAVRRVRSQGGGIYIEEALEAGCEALSKIHVATRHIILLADAADSERPGNYKQILKTAVANGITVSIIGLGSEKDTDAPLLKEIAQLGGGRAFFQSNAFGIPALFAQETMLVSRPSFSEEPLPLTPTAGWNELSASPLRWLPKVDALNLTLPKPGATIAALAQDEDAHPLVAFWKKGAGRTAAVTFPLAGPSSESARNWPDAPRLLASLARWAAAPEHPPGAEIATKIRGTSLEVDFFHEPSWEEIVASTPPRLRFLDHSLPQPQNASWERITPGHFRARLPLSPGNLVQGAVQLGSQSFPFGPLLVPANAEWLKNPAALAELRSVVAATGGSERVDLSECWSLPHSALTERSLQAPLLFLLLLLVLADALHSRIKE
jgi:hypothetical protein